MTSSLVHYYSFWIELKGKESEFYGVSVIRSTFGFPANVFGRIRMFFLSLKPSARQTESSIKFQLIRVSCFGVVREQTNTQIDTLTDILLLKSID